MQEIRKAIEAYYNFCMDEFDGHVSEEAIDIFMEREYPGEMVHRRQRELFRAHPHLTKLANQNPLVRSWLEINNRHYSQTSHKSYNRS